MSQGAELTRLRAEIRAVTLDILRLFGKRQQLARRIGLQKALLGLPVENRRAEEDLRRLVSEECDRVGVRRSAGKSLLNLLLGESKRVQNEVKATSPGGVARLERLAVVGGGGAMGILFARYFKERGHDVAIFDIDPRRARRAAEETGASLRSNLREAVEDVELVLVSVPVEDAPRVIREIVSGTGGGSVVVEISSLKAEIIEALRGAARRGSTPLSLHPLFGPGAGTPRGQNMAVIPVVDEEKELQLASELFPTSALFPVDAEAHDEAVGLTLGLVYYMNVGFASVLADRDPADLRSLGGPFFRLQLLLCEALISQNPGLYLSILRESEEARLLLLKLAAKLREISTDGDLSPEAQETLRMKLAQDPDFSEAYGRIYRLQDLLT